MSLHSFKSTQRLALGNVTNTHLSTLNIGSNNVQKLRKLKIGSQNEYLKEKESEKEMHHVPEYNIIDSYLIDDYNDTDKENEIPSKRDFESRQPRIGELPFKEITNVPTNNTNIAHAKKRPISAQIEHKTPKKIKAEKIKDVEECIWDDLDEEDGNDPLMVSEYVNDIFEHLHQLELLTLPNKEQIIKHKNITHNRDILINWLIKVHNKFGLLPETLYLAINLLDRFLSKEEVTLNKLQLVGTYCLFIASKYEEIYSPSVKHFASETDGACSIDEIKKGEKFVLKALKFNLNYPNPMNFLRRISKADDYDLQSRTLAKFLLEITMIDFNFIDVMPSLCSAAAMFLSRKMLGKGKWNDNLIHYSGGYQVSDLEPVCHMIMDYLNNPETHTELRLKYSSKRFLKASIISVQWANKVKQNGYDVMTLNE